jgi:hypothetical protein
VGVVSCTYDTLQPAVHKLGKLVHCDSILGMINVEMAAHLTGQVVEKTVPLTGFSIGKGRTYEHFK